MISFRTDRAERSPEFLHGIWCVLVSVLVIIPVITGCSATQWNEPSRPTGVALYENPVLIRYDDPQVLWETLADVIDDYFTIQYEFPLRWQDDVITAGRLRTFPQPGANLFEPWRGDSANLDERLRATVQSIRRYAEVTVTPLQGSYLIEVTVFKEIEDVRSDPQTLPLASSANVNAMQRREPLVGEAPITEGWLFLERDQILEQRILTGRQSDSPWNVAGYHRSLGNRCESDDVFRERIDRTVDQCPRTVRRCHW
ncbi:MAG: hypothetical protein Q4C47_03285 [Planctomycetia bacterium]|nr:hypothetical protein [Planctomycetia bacterium]